MELYHISRLDPATDKHSARVRVRTDCMGLWPRKLTQNGQDARSPMNPPDRPRPRSLTDEAIANPITADARDARPYQNARSWQGHASRVTATAEVLQLPLLTATRNRSVVEVLGMKRIHGMPPAGR